nr:PREDICTED: uncharacterized serine/threonine-protein kinase SgK494 [Latimeria chalumnae]|eukprot:XP_005986952.1 PREDICTED: uncharacterized serine/threonine-protein kinase SgK494 [Latimeria chalumnae]
MGGGNSQEKERGLWDGNIPTWKSILSNIRGSVPGLCQFVPDHVIRTVFQTQLRPPGKPLKITEKAVTEWPLPRSTSLFLPEFPVRSRETFEHFEVLGFAAKGSFGPILKVHDRRNEKFYAVKILPKSVILQQAALKQCKEEVITQKRINHPFILRFGDSWQTLHHLFIMCDYCRSGDLYMLWSVIGRFEERTIRVFAAELGLALGFLHDYGIVHRDVKMENVLLDERGHLKLTDFGLSRHLQRGERAYTICGTVHYMAPEVLSGGPYNHSADWWSLGILLFALAVGEFPVASERDHSVMLEVVSEANFEVPHSVERSLSLLLSELLCKSPTRRLHLFYQYKKHPVFHGMTFDPELLQKHQLCFIPDASKTQRPQEQDLFKNFDWNLAGALARPCPP